MKRFAEAQLQKWFGKKRRKPLVVRGARQVGKSTLIRQFAAKHELALHEINLERHIHLDDVFKTLDIDVILKELEAICGVNIQKSGSLLFLDEIQATPHAIQALRYFYEDRPDIPVIAAGSLLEFTLSDHQYSMPVGRIEYYHLGPMTFKEFLSEIEPGLVQYISKFDFETGIPVSAHRKLLKRQREYLFVGGMPEAVLAYGETGSLLDVSEVHASIVDTYQDDFSKYAKQKDLALLRTVFRFIPRSVGKKVKYSNISREHRSKNLKMCIELLTNARICHQVFHSNCSGIPLDADISSKTYKLIFMDVGLVNHMCGVDWIMIQAMDERNLINEGAVAEQFIGQHLLHTDGKAPRLCYWLRESKSANAEVDYVISRGNWILPIEVKAGKSGSLKSLQQFVLQKNTEFAIRFDLNEPSIQNVSHTTRLKTENKSADYTFLSLPLYLVEELPRLMDHMRLFSE